VASRAKRYPTGNYTRVLSARCRSPSNAAEPRIVFPLGSAGARGRGAERGARRRAPTQRADSIRGAVLRIRFEEKSQAGRMFRFTAHVTDTYLAPEISEFDRAEIPDMSATQPESLDWMSNYVRSSVLRGAAPSPQSENRFSFLRRATIVYSEHGLARQATLAYLESEEQSFGKYFMAIHHWDQFLTAAWHALEALRYAAFVGRLHV
jgi:hypothetical protein